MNKVEMVSKCAACAVAIFGISVFLTLALHTNAQCFVTMLAASFVCLVFSLRD